MISPRVDEVYVTYGMGAGLHVYPGVDLLCVNLKHGYQPAK